MARPHFLPLLDLTRCSEKSTGLLLVVGTSLLNDTVVVMAALTKFELSIKKSFLDLLEKSLGKDGQASKVFLYCHEGRWMGHVRVSITRPESTAN